MENKLSLLKLGGAAAFLILVVLLIAAFSGNLSVAVNPGNVASADGGKVDGGFQANPTNPSPPASEPKLGAVSSPDIQSPYFSFGGVRHWGSHAAINDTQALCDITSPVGTSTIRDFTVTITNPYPFTIAAQMGWSATSSANYVNTVGFTIPASKSITVQASTTLQSLYGGVAPEYGVVQPSSHFSVTVASTTPSPLLEGAGFCNMTFRDVN